MIKTELLEALLDRWPVARFASIQSGSTEEPVTAPSLVPIVFCRLGNAIYSPLDGKTKDGRELQRFRNIRANPNVSVLLDQYCEDWRELWWVRLDGTATRYEANPREEIRLADAFRQKYPQYETVPLHLAEPVYIRMVWDRVRAWGQTDASGAIQTSLKGLS